MINPKTMKIFKNVLTVLISILIIIVVVGLVLPKNVTIERPIAINSPVDSVFVQVSHFRNMSEWSPWKDYDPDMKVTYEGTDGQVGAVYKWEGNGDVGKGSQEITSIEKNKRIDIELSFIEPWESRSD